LFLWERLRLSCHRLWLKGMFGDRTCGVVWPLPRVS
jgi:hypothetical protein